MLCVGRNIWKAFTERCLFIIESNLIWQGKESQAGSFAEFKQRIQICLREAKETHYWYRIINQLEIGDRNLCSILLQESTEIMLIFGSISSKTKNKIKD